MYSISRICPKIQPHIGFLSFSPHNHRLQTLALRFFSIKTDDESYFAVGPAPSQPLQPGDPGYARFLKNLETFHKFGRETYLALQKAKKILELNQIIDTTILKGQVVWEEIGIMGLKANLGNSITAYLIPGHEDRPTSITVSSGFSSVRCELSEYWLDNSSNADNISKKD